MRDKKVVGELSGFDIKMENENLFEFGEKRFVQIIESVDLIDRFYGITKVEREAIEAMRGNFVFEEDDFCPN